MEAKGVGVGKQGTLNVDLSDTRQFFSMIEGVAEKQAAVGFIPFSG